MISTVTVAILLALVIVFLLKAKILRLSGAIVCVLFGLVIGITPIGDQVQHALSASGTWIWGQVTRA